MSESFALWSDSFVDAAAWLLAHATWLGCACAVSAWIMVRLLRTMSAGAQHAVLCGWLLLIPVGAVVLTPWQSLGTDADDGLQTAPPVPESLNADSRGPATIITTEQQQTVEASALPNSSAEQVSVTSPPVTLVTVAESEGSTNSSFSLASARTWLPWIVSTWLCGVLVLSLRLVFGWHRVRRRMFSDSVPASDRIQALATRIAEQLRLPRAVHVLEALGAEVPTTIGFLRPVIFLPVSIATNLTPMELEAILAHELAHIRRHDFLVNLIQTILETLLFYHPAVWWLSASIRQQRENACDDIAVAVVGDRLQYARALTEVAALSRQHQLTLAATGSDLGQRVRRIAGLPPTHMNRSVSFWSGTMLLSGVVVAALLLAPGLTPESPAIEPAATEEQNDLPEEERTVADDSTFKPVAGVILGPDRKPMAGATVHLRLRPYPREEDVLLGKVTTGADGRFRFEDIKKPPFNKVQRLYPQDVIVTKPGHMIRWQLLNAARDDIRIQLKKDTPYSATLKDENGAPIADAEVRVENIMSLNTISKIDLVGGHFPNDSGASYLNVSRSPVSIAATTDQDGRFTLRGLPHRVGMELKVYDKRVSSRTIYAATTKEKLPRLPVHRSAIQPARDTVRRIVDGPLAVDRAPIHGFSSEIVVKRATHLAVRVINAETGNPVPGATVTGIINGASDHDTNPVGVDENGLAHFHRIVSQRFPVTVDAPRDSVLQSASHSIPVAEGNPDQEFTIKMQRGVVITGRVTDAKTGEGIEGVRLYACHFGANGPLRQHGAGNHHPVVPRFGHRVQTQADGSYRVVVSPDCNAIFVVQVTPGYKGPYYSGTIRLPSDTDLVARIEPAEPSWLTSINFQLKPVAQRLVRFVDEADKPVTCSVTCRAESTGHFGGVSFQEVQVDVDGEATLNVAPHTDRGSSLASAVQLIARSQDNRLAAFFRTRHVEDLGDTPATVVMKPVAAVRGRVVDAVTKEPVPRAIVGLSIRYTRRRGQGLARTECDKQGYFEFKNLIPDMKYSIGTKADQYEARNSINDPFNTVSGTTHEMEIPLQPLKPATRPGVPELTAITAPAWQELPPEKAFRLLRDEFNTAHKAYRRMLEEDDSPYSRDNIVQKREPSAAFTVAMMALANRNPDSKTELDALKWVCQRSRVSGTEQRHAHLRPQAAQRLLDKYADRAELADAVGSIIYSVPESYAAAEKLMASPHREVQGQARFTAARMLTNRYQYQGNDPVLHAEAIRLYQEVIADYADLKSGSTTLGDVAELALFQLQHLQDGKMAPEIEGVDLNGRPMKISDFQGQVVVIHYWHPGLPYFDQIADMVDEYTDKPVVFICINCGRDHADTELCLSKLPAQCKHLDDVDGEIHRRWSPGIPSTHVIGHDGRIVYLDHGRSQGSLEGALQRAVRAATEPAPAIPSR